MLLFIAFNRAFDKKSCVFFLYKKLKFVCQANHGMNCCGMVHYRFLPPAQAVWLCLAPIAKSHNVAVIIAAYCMPLQLPLVQ